MDDILSRENVHPLKGCTLVVLQNTMWLGMSTALANMCCVFPHSDPGIYLLAKVKFILKIVEFLSSELYTF